MKNNPDWKNIKRVLILGGSGTGKSTLAKLIGKNFNLEVIHLDQHFHNPGWVPKVQNEFREIVKQLVQKNRWVMDGTYSNTLKDRIPAADLIILFDFPSYFCVYRVLTRCFKSKLGIEVRSDLPMDCEEKWFDWEFVKFVWNFKKTRTPVVFEILEESEFDKEKIIIFRKTVEVNKFSKELKLYNEFHHR